MMDNLDEYNWLLDDIDNTLIFMLRDGKEMLGSYRANSLMVNGNEAVKIRFANIMDLTDFINYGMVRFVNTVNKDNIVDIPIRKLGNLYKACSTVIDSVPQGITLNELDTFSVYNDKVIKDGYAIYGYKIGEVSDELNQIMVLSGKFDKLNMNDKIEALEDINLINYERSKKDNKTRR